MLSEKEQHDISTELHHYPDKRAACVEALKIVQQARGWVSDESLKDVAAFLDMTPDELDSVATFYNLIFRQPVGKHVILVCDSISCWIMGAERVCTQLTDRLGITFGETSADGRFTLLPISCLGTCEHAPALMIDDALHHGVRPEQVETLLTHYREP